MEPLVFEGQNWQARAVLVRWTDARGELGWDAVEAAQDMTLAQCVSVGFMVAQDATRVVLCLTLDPETASCNDRIVIPMGWVSGIEEVVNTGVQYAVTPPKKGA